MRRKTRFILHHVQRRIKKAFINEYGEGFYQQFCLLSVENLDKDLPWVPDISKSIFKLNYYWILCYFAWFKALKHLGQPVDQAIQTVWFINEEYFKSWPRPFLRMIGKVMYSGGHRRKAREAAEKAKNDQLHPYDWKIRYLDIDKNTYQLDIYECGALKLGKLLDAEEMFPAICRLDYLLSHYFGNEFKRQGTLADGWDCCDSRFHFPGYTPWPVPMDIEGRHFCTPNVSQ